MTFLLSLILDPEWPLNNKGTLLKYCLVLTYRGTQKEQGGKRVLLRNLVDPKPCRSLLEPFIGTL